MSQVKKIQSSENVFKKDDQLAQTLRLKFAESQVLVLNLVSSPGSGKTTLLERTITDLKSDFAMAVIEGDQQTSRDAQRIAKTGVAVHQINTISGCHLDSAMITSAISNFSLNSLDVLFIENVGNLVCPAAFDLGEDFRVLTLSVTEGEDKPIKYPNMFLSAHVMLINKVDLLPVLDFQMDECLSYIRRLNPEGKVFNLSARSGAGMANWYQWLREAVENKKSKSSNCSKYLDHVSKEISPQPNPEASEIKDGVVSGE